MIHSTTLEALLLKGFYFTTVPQYAMWRCR